MCWLSKQTLRTVNKGATCASIACRCWEARTVKQVERQITSLLQENTSKAPAASTYVQSNESFSTCCVKVTRKRLQWSCFVEIVRLNNFDKHVIGLCTHTRTRNPTSEMLRACTMCHAKAEKEREGEMVTRCRHPTRTGSSRSPAIPATRYIVHSLRARRVVVNQDTCGSLCQACHALIQTRDHLCYLSDSRQEKYLRLQQPKTVRRQKSYVKERALRQSCFSLASCCGCLVAGELTYRKVRQHIDSAARHTSFI